jgi:hypothetical protein
MEANDPLATQDLRMGDGEIICTVVRAAEKEGAASSLVQSKNTGVLLIVDGG